MSVQFDSLWPVWLLALLVLALLAATAHGAWTMVRKHIAPRWVGSLTLLRLAAIAVFVLIVLQPALSWTSTATSQPTLAILVDASASMQPHREQVLKSLREGSFANAIDQQFRPRWFRFDAGALPITKDELAKLPADGVTTHIADSLAGALTLLQAEGTACQRVLLVSDGRDQGGADTAELARKLGVRVDVLAPAAKTNAEADGLTIADVQGARRILLGSETHFRVTLTGRSAAQDRKVVLRLVEDGKAVQDVTSIVQAGVHETVMTVAHRPGTAGTKTYEFQLPDGGNKSAPFPVQVVDGKFEILVLEDTWRWEYKFLHRLFEDDPSFRFTALLSRGGGSFTQFGSPDRRVSLIGFPQSRAELEGFDLFFVGDVNPSRWPPRLASALAHLVSEEGKSLVVIAGPNLAGFADVPELNALLPVEVVASSGKPVPGPIGVRLRPDAASSPFFFQISGNLVDALPPLDQLYPPLRKRPGATVLAEAAKLRNPYGPLVVAAEHTVGRGRVLFIGADTLWKWHTLAPAKDGPTPYALFWQQAMRALTPERSRLGTVDLWLRPSRSRCSVGQSVELAMEISSERPLPHVSLQAQATLPDGERVPLAFRADPARPTHYRAEFAPPRAGTYTLSAAATVDGQRAAENSVLVHAEEHRGETSDGGVDLPALQRLATATGGKMIDPDRPDTWPQPETTSGPSIVQPRTWALADSFTLLLLLCALLGADWFVRLMKGLV